VENDRQTPEHTSILQICIHVQEQRRHKFKARKIIPMLNYYVYLNFPFQGLGQGCHRLNKISVILNMDCKGRKRMIGSKEKLERLLCRTMDACIKDNLTNGYTRLLQCQKKLMVIQGKEASGHQK